jgi:rod shape-determining protein MreB and related proteins
VLSKKIGIDLGTSSVTVYVKGEGIVLREPPAGNRETGPMLQRVIGRVVGRQRIFRPEVMLSVPGEVTGVERRAVLEATMQAGAKSAYLIEKPLAAAIGAGIAIGDTEGIAVCDLGASGAEAALIAHGEMVAFAAIPVGGDRLDQAIAEAVVAGHGLRIEKGEAERLKLELGRALPREPDPSGPARALEVSGIVEPADDARPPKALIDAQEVCSALAPLLEELAQGLAALIREAPPTVAAGLARNGLVLSGGAAQLRDLDRFLGGRLKIPAVVARNAQACVATGTGLALDNLQMIRRGQHYIT